MGPAALTRTVSSDPVCQGMVIAQVFVRQTTIADMGNVTTTGANLIANAIHACALVVTQEYCARNLRPARLCHYRRTLLGVLVDHH